MIRITELRLPIDHAPEDLEVAILRRLRLAPKDLISFQIFKRSYDARKNVTLAFIYTIDLSVKNEEVLLNNFPMMVIFDPLQIPVITLWQKHQSQ